MTQVQYDCLWAKEYFRCDLCNSFSCNLIKHIATVHEGKKELKCDICQKSIGKKMIWKITFHVFMTIRKTTLVKFLTQFQYDWSWAKNISNVIFVALSLAT